MTFLSLSCGPKAPCHPCMLHQPLPLCSKLNDLWSNRATHRVLENRCCTLRGPPHSHLYLVVVRAEIDSLRLACVLQARRQQGHNKVWLRSPGSSLLNGKLMLF